RWAAAAYSAQGRYAEGEQLFQEGLDRISRLPGNQSRNRVLFQFYLASSLASRGALGAAEAELNRCRAEAGNSGDADNFPTALGALRPLAWVHVLRNNPAAAEPLAVEALTKFRRVMGNRHAYTLGAILVLARIYQAQGRYELAAPLIAEAEDGCRGS